MSDFRLIALALWLTAGCQVYDRVPWGRCWRWLTAKALALRSWVFSEVDAHEVAMIDWHRAMDEYRSEVRAADEPPPAPPNPYEPFKPAPRRRPSRAFAAEARKAKK